MIGLPAVICPFDGSLILFAYSYISTIGYLGIVACLLVNVVIATALLLQLIVFVTFSYPQFK